MMTFALVQGAEAVIELFAVEWSGGMVMMSLLLGIGRWWVVREPQISHRLRHVVGQDDGGVVVVAIGTAALVDGRRQHSNAVPSLDVDVRSQAAMIALARVNFIAGRGDEVQMAAASGPDGQGRWQVAVV